MVQDAKDATENARAEMESARIELQQAREATTAAVAKAAADEKTAGERISELEIATEKAEREREMMRTRVESRLEALGLAFEQEQKEDRTQVQQSKRTEELKNGLTKICFIDEHVYCS